MSPPPTALLCLGLCLGQAARVQGGHLPKPSLQALPSSLVPLEKSVTIECRGPPGVDLYRLEKLGSGSYRDEADLFIPAMRTSHAGCYRCSYQNGSRWSPPSDNLELVATGGVHQAPQAAGEVVPGRFPHHHGDCRPQRDLPVLQLLQHIPLPVVGAQRCPGAQGHRSLCGPQPVAHRGAFLHGRPSGCLSCLHGASPVLIWTSSSTAAGHLLCSWARTKQQEGPSPAGEPGPRQHCLFSGSPTPTVCFGARVSKGRASAQSWWRGMTGGPRTPTGTLTGRLPPGMAGSLEFTTLLRMVCNLNL